MPLLVRSRSLNVGTVLEIFEKLQQLCISADDNSKENVFLPITSKIKLTMKSFIIREEFFQPIKYILSIDM